MEFSYYSYCRKPTGREFFVLARTQIGVKLLTTVCSDYIIVKTLQLIKIFKLSSRCWTKLEIEAGNPMLQNKQSELSAGNQFSYWCLYVYDAFCGTSCQELDGKLLTWLACVHFLVKHFHFKILLHICCFSSFWSWWYCPFASSTNAVDSLYSSSLSRLTVTFWCKGKLGAGP